MAYLILLTETGQIASKRQIFSYQPFQPSRFGLHFDRMGLATAENSFCTFLMTKQILNSSQNCDSCYSPMVLTSCAVTKSADLFIWRCRPCMKTKNIRSGSVLQPGLQPAISTFLIEVDHQHQSRCSQVLTPQSVKSLS